MMIRIINEADENIVVYNADEVVELADEIMSLYTAEHERHRKAVGNISVNKTEYNHKKLPEGIALCIINK
jgi:hypothetical protein